MSGSDSRSQESGTRVPGPLPVPRSHAAVVACYKMKDKLYPDTCISKNDFSDGPLEERNPDTSSLDQ